MDMVCEKANEKVHDFKNDPIEFKIEGICFMQRIQL